MSICEVNGAAAYDNIPDDDFITSHIDSFFHPDDTHPPNVDGSTEEQELDLRSLFGFLDSPIVESLEVKGNYNPFSGGTSADVTTKVYDPSGIQVIYLATPQDWINIRVSPSDVDDDGLIVKTVNLNTNALDWVSGWDLRVWVRNGAYNILDEDMRIQGVTDVANWIYDFFAEIWDLIKGAITSVAAAVTEMANALVGWVENHIAAILLSVIDPILTKIDDYVGELVELIYNSVELGEDINNIEFVQLFYSEVFYATLALSAALMAASYILKGISFGSTTVIGLIIPFVIGFLVAQMFSEYAPYDQGGYNIGAGMCINGLFEYLEGLIHNIIDTYGEGMNTVLEDQGDFLLVLLGVVIASFGLPFSTGLLADAIHDHLGFFQSTVSLSCVILSMFFAIAGLIYRNKNNPEPEKGFISSVASVMFGGIGLLFGAWAGHKIGGQNLVNSVSTVLGLIALAFGLVSLAI